MSNAVTLTATIDGTSAINLSNTSGSTASVVFDETTQPNIVDNQRYAVTISGAVTYQGAKMPLKQAFVFNTRPLTDADYYDWYHLVSVDSSADVTFTKGNPIYIFLVDQVTSSDNTGSFKITFTPIG